MKKRLIALVLIIAMLTALVFTCISCSTGIFEVDEERDYKEVIATVKYGDLSKDIYKGQLKSYVNSYGASYQQNYNMTIEEIVEYFYNTLTKSALLSLYAKYYVYEKAQAGDPDYAYIDTSKSIKDLSDKDFVSLPELVYSIDQTNDDFLSSYESILSGLVKKADDEEEEETDEDALDPRTVRTYTEKDRTAYDKDLTSTSIAAIYGPEYRNVKYGQITEDFVKNTLKEESVDAFVAKLDIFNVISAKIKTETDSQTKKDMKSALKTLRDNISKSYTDYDWFLSDALSSCVINDLKDGLKATKTATDDQIDDKYKKLINDNLSNLTESTYSSAISGSTFLPVNASQEYAGVKSILLKFSEEQSTALTAIKAMYSANPDKVAELRDAIALGEQGTIVDELLKDNKGIKVNISNAFYDADEDKIDAAYTDKDVNYLVVLYVMADSIANISAQIVDAYKATEEYNALSAQDKQIAEAIVAYSAKVEAFTQWMYLVNDDSGMFSSEAYTITPEGEDTSYVAEYTVLARKLAKQDIGAYTSSTYEAVTPEIKSVDYTTGSEQYKVENKEAKVYVELNEISQTKSDELKANVYTVKTEAGNTISFIVNDYGIHIVMVTEKYGQSNFVNDVVNKIDDKGNVVAADEKGYAYTLDAIYDRATTIDYDYDYTAVAADATFDENAKYYLWKVTGFERADVTAETFNPSKYTYYTREWKLQNVECEYKTLKANLDDAIVTSIFSNEYSASQIALYLNTSEKSASITKVDKVYDELIKSYNSNS